MIKQEFIHKHVQNLPKKIESQATYKRYVVTLIVCLKYSPQMNPTVEDALSHYIFLK